MREQRYPEAYAIYENLADPEELRDPATGIILTPSWHGEKCAGSGDDDPWLCCCDECDYYLACFPDCL